MLAWIRRNANLSIAIGIVAIFLAVVGYWTWPVWPSLITYGEENPRSAEYRPGGEKCQPSALASIREGRELARQTDACHKEAEEYRQNTSDLIKQARSANAAEAQVDIASQELLTGWLQTLGGLLTLFAAVGAAVFARDAAGHTRCANEITLVLQRPWITLRLEPQLTRPYKNGLYFRLKLVAENVGQTEAAHLNVRTDILFRNESETTDQFAARTLSIVSKWADASRSIKQRSLVPKDTEIAEIWTDKQRPELVEEVIIDGVRAAHPIVLGAVIYRRPTSLDTLEISWRTWHLESIQENDENLPFIRVDQVLRANQLVAGAHSAGMMHDQRPAKD